MARISKAILGFLAVLLVPTAHAALVHVEAEDTSQVTQGGTRTAYSLASYSGGVALKPQDAYLGQTLTISFVSAANGSFSVYGTECPEFACNNTPGPGLPPQGPWPAHFFDIQLDGSPAISVSTLSPDGGFHHQQEHYSFTGLSAGTHTVVLTSTANSQFVEIDFFTYESAVVPVPSAVYLFGSALGLLGWIRRGKVF